MELLDKQQHYLDSLYRKESIDVGKIKVEASDKSNNRYGKLASGLVDFIQCCNNPRIVCEIGSAWGDSAQIWLDTLPNIVLFCIDPWCVENPSDSSNEVGYIFFKERFKKNKNIIQIREYSDNVIGMFPDKFFDVLYLDSIHTYKEVSDNIYKCEDKIKIGGFIGGHDYNKKVFPGCVKAVDDYMCSNRKRINGRLKIFKDTSWLIQI